MYSIMGKKGVLHKTTILQYNVPYKEHSMDLNLLKIFEKVAEVGSLTKASTVLGHPKSKISRDLVKLEDELEQTLLIRGPRGIVLTEKGLSLLQLIRTPLESLDASVLKIKNQTNEMKGLIKITAPEDLSQLILTDIVCEFMDKYPGIRIELYSTNILMDFKEHKLDMALRIGKLKDSSLIQKKVCDIEVGLVASAQYLKTSTKVNEVNDLQKHPVAILTDLYGNPLNKSCFKEVVPQFASNSFPILKDYVAKNKGPAMIPSFYCKRELVENSFIKVLPDLKYLARTLFLLSKPSKHTPKHVKIFKDYLYENLKRSLES